MGLGGRTKLTQYLVKYRTFTAPINVFQSFLNEIRTNALESTFFRTFKCIVKAHALVPCTSAHRGCASTGYRCIIFVKIHLCASTNAHALICGVVGHLFLSKCSVLRNIKNQKGC